MLNLAFTRGGTGTSDRRRSATAILVVALGLVFSVACASAAIKDAPASPASPTTSTPMQDRETVRGRFVIVTGDPPPDSGQPARRSYILTDQQGRRWTLTFDESVYSPPGGISAFNGKDVEVEGRRTGTNRLLVESMRLL
jgi:hypothetical protein